MKDVFDRDFTVGDVICWPWRQGSSMGMNKGRILEIRGGKLIVGDWPSETEGSKHRTICVTNRVVIVREPVA